MPTIKQHVMGVPTGIVNDGRAVVNSVAGLAANMKRKGATDKTNISWIVKTCHAVVVLIADGAALREVSSSTQTHALSN